MKAQFTSSGHSMSPLQAGARAALGAIVVGGVLVGAVIGLRGAFHPLNRSAFDGAWALLYGGVLACVGLTCWLCRGRLLIVLTLIGITGFVLLNMIGGHAAFAWLLLGWLLTVCGGLGGVTLKWLARPRRIGVLERLVLAISVGLGEVALLTLAMGAFHVIYRWVAFVALSGLTIVFWPVSADVARQLLKSGAELKRMWQEGDLRFSSVVLGTLGVCLLGALMWAVSPSIHFDALNYHLGVPAIYVQHHSVVEVPEEFRSYWAHNAEMLYTFALTLVGQPLPTLIHLTFGLLTMGLVFSLGNRLMGRRAGLVAAALFYSMPIVTWESGVAYTDLMVTFYAFGATYAVFVWWLEQDDVWLTIAGLLAGFGLGTKLSAILMLVPLSVLVMCAVPLRYGASFRSLMGLLRFGVPAVVLVAPWFVRDWFWTGNPIFPFYNSIFQSPTWPRENTFLNFGMFGKGHGVLSLLRLPWDLTIDPGAFVEAGRPGLVGGLPLLALPWLYPWYSPGLGRLPAIMLGFVLGVVVLWFIIGQYLRYLLPLFPLLAILAALNLEILWLMCVRYSRQKQVAALALVGALCYVAATRIVDAISGWQIPERYPYRVALGLETPQSFLARAVPVYDALQFLNTQGEGKHKVLSVGNDFRMYTTSRIFSVHGSREGGLFAFLLPPGAHLAHTLERQGYDFLLINQNEIRARPGMYQLAVLDESFLQRFARLEFARRNVYVYRLLGHASEGSSVKAENLLTNNGFEQAGAHGGLAGWFAYGSGLIDRTGTRSHSGQVGVQASYEVGFFQRVAILPGELYTLGHWTRADQPNQFARLQINWLDSSLKMVDASIDVISTHSAWRWNQHSVTAPGGATFAQVYVSVHEDGKVWFDDFQFVQGTIHAIQ